MTDNAASLDFYDQGAKVSLLEVAFLLGRHRVRYGWHFVQHELLYASILAGGDEPRLKTMKDAEWTQSRTVFAALCQRAAVFLSNSESARLAHMPTEFRQRMSLDDYLAEVQNILAKMELRGLHEGSEDVLQPFVDAHIEKPYLAEIERLLRIEFDEAAGRWFEVGIALEWVLCPPRNWRCMCSTAYWSRAERERFRDQVQKGEIEICVDADSEAEEIDGPGHTRLVRFSCPPGYARFNGAESLIAGRLHAACGNELSNEIGKLNSSLNQPSVREAVPVTNVELDTVLAKIDAAKRSVEKVDGSSESFEEADERLHEAKDAHLRFSSNLWRLRDVVDAKATRTAVEQFHLTICDYLRSKNGPAPTKTVSYGGLKLDSTNLKLTREGQTTDVPISAGQEHDFLAKIIQAQGAFVIHNELIDIDDPLVDIKKTLQPLATKLRHKLKNLDAWVHNDRKLGYRLIFRDQ